MQRRGFIAGLAALALAAACATPAPVEAPAASGGFSSERISVVTGGSGPDVILIPGLTSHRDIWATTAAALEGSHRVHLVQVNGFAGAPPGANADGPVSAPVAEELARYIAEARLERPAVIGHSMGGTIAMMLAARHPDAVGRVLVVDMFPFMGAMFGPPGATADSVRPIADQIRSQMMAAPPGTATPMVEQMLASMVRTESARPQMMQYARASTRSTVANAFHELIVTDLRPELANIRAPLTVLYVIPPNAPVPPEQYDQFMRASYASVPSARLVKIENSYHFIMVDAFEPFMMEVERFLGD